MNKSAEECETFEEKLYHCILHMEKMEVMPKNFDEDYFKALNRAARTANFTGEELEEYRKAMRTERDLINQLAYAHDEGAADARKKVALELRKQGILSMEQIAQTTGLAIDVIKSL